VQRKISGFHQDDSGDWVADLECGHSRHVRHNPPWQVREWVTTEEGRAGRIGQPIDCGECESAPSEAAPPAGVS
jgi:hypothetical protein